MEAAAASSSSLFNKDRIRLKCRYEGDIRTVIIQSNTIFSELKKRLTIDFGFEVSLKYEDHEGDLITLSSQNDLNDLFLYENAETINVVVSESVSLPQLNLKAVGKQPSSGNILQAITPVNGSRELSRSVVGTPSQSMALPKFPNQSVRLDRFPSINDRFQQQQLYQQQQQEMHGIRWKRGEMLGQGAFGVVYLGLNIDTGELMAVKQMATEEVSKKELSSLENEINLLRTLRHPNIVRYIGTELTSASLSIFLEYVPGGSLKALIEKFGSLEESVARSYTRQLLLGLEYLHRNGIAHRDVKGANCLVGNDGVIKLADFGNSKHWRPNGIPNANINATQTGDLKGTPAWMAPEVVRDQGGISWRKTDIWSLACTTLEMTTGKAPWSQFNNSVTILYHLACQETLPEYPYPASTELLTFLNICLQRDPSNRPDVTSLLLHPFVSSPSNNGWGLARPTTVSSMMTGDWDFNSGPSAFRNSYNGARKLNSVEERSAPPTRAAVIDPLNSFPNIGSRSRTNSASTIPLQALMVNTGPNDDVASVASDSSRLSGSTRGDVPLLRPASSGSIARVQVPPLSLAGHDVITPRNLTSAILASQRIPHSPLSTGLGTTSQRGAPPTIATTVSDPESTHEVVEMESVPPSREAGFIVAPAISPEVDGYLSDVTANTRITAMPDVDLLANEPAASDITTASQFSQETAERGVLNNETPAAPIISVNSNAPTPKPLNNARKKLANKKQQQQQQQQQNRRSATRTTKLSAPSEDSSAPSPSLRQKGGGSGRASANAVVRKSMSIAPSVVVAPSESSLTETADEQRPKTVVIPLNLPAPRDDMALHEENQRLQRVDSIDEGKILYPNKSESVALYDSDDGSLGYNADTASYQGNGEYDDEEYVVEDTLPHFYASGGAGMLSGIRDEDDVIEEELVEEEHIPEEEAIRFALPSASPRTIPPPKSAQKISEKGTDSTFGTPERERALTAESGWDQYVHRVSSDHNHPTRQAGIDKQAADSQPLDILSDLGINGASLNLKSKRSSADLRLSIGGETAKSLLTNKNKPVSSNTVGAISNSPGHQGQQKRKARGQQKKELLLDGKEKDGEMLEISCDSLEISGMAAGPKTHSFPSQRNVELLSHAPLTAPSMIRGHGESPSREGAIIQDAVKKPSTAVLYGSMDLLEDSVRLDHNHGSLVDSDPAKSLVDCEPFILEEHSASVSRLRAPRKTSLLVSASLDGTVRVWSATDHQSQAVLDTAAFNTSTIGSAVATERRVSLGTKSLPLDDPDNETPLLANGRQVKVVNLWCEENCDSIWSACSDGTLRVWNGGEFRPLRLIKGHEEAITCMEGLDANSMSGSNSALVATGSVDRTIRMWDLRAKKTQVFVFRGHGDTVLTLKWCEGGRAMVSGGKDKTIKIWDTRAGRLRNSIEKHFGSVNCLRVLSDPTSNVIVGGAGAKGSDGPSFISAGRDAMINFWNSSGDCINSQSAHRGYVSYLSEVNFSTTLRPTSANYSSPVVLSAGSDSVIKLWDLKRCKCIADVTASLGGNYPLTGNITKIVWCGQTSNSFVTASSSGQIRLFEKAPSLMDSDLQGNTSLTRVAEWNSTEMLSHSQSCTDLVSSDNMIACSSKSGRIFRWNF